MPPRGGGFGVRTLPEAKLRGGCLLESWRSREYRGCSTSQGSRFAPRRLDPPNRPQGCRFAGVIILSMIF